MIKEEKRICDFISPQKKIMQHILNAKEKNKFVYEFPFLWLLATALIASGAYFIYELVIEDSKTLIENVNQYKRENENLENFISVVQDIKVMKDSMNRTVTNKQHMDSIIGCKLEQLYSCEIMTKSLYEKLNSVTLEIMFQFSQSKNDVLNLKKEMDDIEVLQKSLTKRNDNIPKQKMPFNVDLLSRIKPIVN